MLKVKAFRMSDDRGVNELLTNYRLAPGASILVSDGRVMIPYEDGLPETIEQRKVTLLESKHKTQSEISIIAHGQGVLENKINGATSQIKDIKKRSLSDHDNNPDKKTSKEIYEHTQQLKTETKRLENVIKQFEVNMVNNQAEITNKQEDIKIYDLEIELCK